MLVLAVGSITVLLFSLPNMIGVEQVYYTITDDVSTETTAEKTAVTTVGEDEKANASTSKKTTVKTTAKTTAAAVTFPLNVNTATVDELMEVPGIGEVLAARIVEFREQYGNFTSLEQLLQVKGIGEKRFENWLPYLTL